MDVKKHVTDEQQQTVIQVPEFLQKQSVDEQMNNVEQTIIDTVQQIQSGRDNDIRHMRDCTAKAEAMDKQEQEATVKGISSDVMFAELLNRQMYYEEKMNKICEVMGDA